MPKSTAPNAVPGLSKSSGKGRFTRKSLPVWAWVVIGILAIVISVFLSPLFTVLFLVVLITGIVGLARNTPTWLRFKSRSVAGWVTAASAVAFLMTVSVAGMFLGGSGEREPVAFADIPSTSVSPSTPPPVSTPTPTPTPTFVTASVVSVTDGFTIETNLGSVRIVGIDVPAAGAWGYAEAATALTAFLATGQVTLHEVEGRGVDEGGRLLRYVQVNGQDAGTHMIGTGWAAARYDSRDGAGAHPLEASYISLDTASEMPAQPAPEPAPVQPEPAPAQPEPAQPATDPQFRTCGVANDNGYGNYQAGVDPEYNWYQDRDKDGWVCEF